MKRKRTPPQKVLKDLIVGCRQNVTEISSHKPNEQTVEQMFQAKTYNCDVLRRGFQRVVFAVSTRSLFQLHILLDNR